MYRNEEDENEKQKIIFSKNLNYYISLTGKMQNEIAKDLQIPATTFNTWCVGKVMPKMGKVQKLADYFKIFKTDLTDEKLDSDARVDARIIADSELNSIVRKYLSLSDKNRESLKNIIMSLPEGTEN